MGRIVQRCRFESQDSFMQCRAYESGPGRPGARSAGAGPRSSGWTAEPGLGSPGIATAACPRMASCSAAPTS
eukprot:12577915-Alexandrium_andersonii.AAC.1